MKKLLQRMVIKLYEKLDCRKMDKEDFWNYHIFYALPKGVNPEILIARLNENNGQIEKVGTWNKNIGFKK